MARDRDNLPTPSTPADVNAFLAQVASTPPAARSADERGRLIFAMDATVSREPTWDRACHLQGEMFRETDSLGGLDVQLCYFRGFRDFAASRWISESSELLTQMTAVTCAGGMTQIERVLAHAADEVEKRKIHAVVFVGDSMEEDLDRLCHLAGELGLLGVPVFAFHEGGDPIAERAFREIARLSRGAYCPFDTNSAQQLRDLLSAVAVYAAGGRKALESFGSRRGGAAQMLTHQMKK